jgi:hypothetical protein
MAGKQESVASRWSPSPPKVDGRADDWAGTELALWEKGDVHYGFRNDADRLYILLVFKNPKFLSTIAQTGISLYFDQAGRKGKAYAIHFLRRQVPVEEAIAFIERERALSEEEKNQLLAKPAYNIYDSTVKAKKAKASAAPVSPPAHFRFSPDQGSVVYEFMVPLRRDHELAAGVGAAAGGGIMIGFEWGGPTEEQQKRAARAAGEAGIANEEIAHGSVDRMTGTRGAPVPPKHSFWASVQLAPPPR